MEKIFDSFYNRFILRDLLSIFSPGLIVVYSIWDCFSKSYCFNPIKNFIENFESSKYSILFFLIPIIAFIYTVGLLINELRDRCLLLAGWYEAKKNTDANLRYDEKLKAYYKFHHNINSKDNAKKHFLEYFEHCDRLIIMFQTSGNIGISICIFSFLQIIKNVYLAAVTNLINEVRRDIIFIILSLLLGIIFIILSNYIMKKYFYYIIEFENKINNIK